MLTTLQILLHNLLKPVMILNVFNNKELVFLVLLMYNTCLACAPLHFTTPSHFQSFSFPFPASGWKGQLLSTWDE